MWRFWVKGPHLLYVAGLAHTRQLEGVTERLHKKACKISGVRVQKKGEIGVLAPLGASCPSAPPTFLICLYRSNPYSFKDKQSEISKHSHLAFQFVSLVRGRLEERGRVSLTSRVTACCTYRLAERSQLVAPCERGPDLAVDFSKGW